MKCEIVHTMMMIDPFGRPTTIAGTGITVAVCETHRWSLGPAMQSAGVPTICPIGRIEEATEKAIADVNAAKKIVVGWDLAKKEGA